jgi:hypothetical protein
VLLYCGKRFVQLFHAYVGCMALCLRSVGEFVGVILHRQPSVGSFDFVKVGARLEPEQGKRLRNILQQTVFRRLSFMPLLFPILLFLLLCPGFSPLKSDKILLVFFYQFGPFLRRYFEKLFKFN